MGCEKTLLLFRPLHRRTDHPSLESRQNSVMALFDIARISFVWAQRTVDKMRADLTPKKIKINLAFSRTANFATKIFNIKCACSVDIVDGKGYMRGRATEIDKLFEKSAHCVFYITPLNKIVGDLGVLALNKEMWRPASG